MLRKGLWSLDKHGERWLENGGELILANTSKKGKSMAKFRKGSAAAKAHMAYVSSFRKGGHKKKKHAKHNTYSAGMIANPGKKSHAKRNAPSFSVAGMRFPTLEVAGGAIGGLILPPLTQNLANRFLPASITSNPIGGFVVQAGSVILPAWLIRRFVSATAGNLVLYVGLAAIVANKIQGLLPTFAGMGSQPFLGYYPGMSGMGQYLGAYRGEAPGVSRRQIPMMQAPMSAGIPERLQAGSRF